MAFTVAGRTIEPEKKPLERGGTTYVPVAEVARYLGATVNWDNEAKQAEIQAGDRLVRLDMASEVADVDGKEMRMSAPVFVLDGTLYVPADFFQFLGFSARVNGDEVVIG